MKILYQGAIGLSGGYSLDGIGIIRALRERGHHVVVVPTGMQPPLPVDIAQSLSVENYQGPPYDLRITHQSPLDVELSVADAKKAKLNIWWSMWEWENYPSWDDFVHNGSTMIPPLGERTKAFDWFVAYDTNSFSAITPHISSSLATGICQGGYESENWMPDPEKIQRENFIFGTLGDISGRKNPAVLIEAYRIFKDEHPGSATSLVIKSRKPFRGHVLGPFLDEDYQIFELNGVWDRNKMEDFYRSLGVYVAPSYGEGKNLPALEAATNGIPLILSDIPGHRGWASSFDSILFVGGTRANLRIDGVPMWGLKVDARRLAAAMSEIYHNRDIYSEKARANVRSIAQAMDWSKSIERLRNLTKVDFL